MSTKQFCMLLPVIIVSSIFGGWLSGGGINNALARSTTWVEAEGFRLLDADGMERIRIYSNNNGMGTIGFFDRYGQPALNLGLEDSPDAGKETILALSDPRGQVRARISLLGDQRVSIEACNSQGNALAKMYAGDQDEAGLVLKNKDGKDRLSFHIDSRQIARLSINDPAGDTRITLGSGGDGNPALGMRDEAGINRLAFHVGAEGTPWIGVMDGEGNARAALTQNALGVSLLEFFDSGGITRAAMGTDPEGYPSLNLRDVLGIKRITMAASPEACTMAWFSEHGRPQLSLGAELGTGPGLSFYDRSGASTLGVFGVNTADMPVIDLRNRSGDVIWRTTESAQSPRLPRGMPPGVEIAAPAIND